MGLCSRLTYRSKEKKNDESGCNEAEVMCMGTNIVYVQWHESIHVWKYVGIDACFLYVCTYVRTHVHVHKYLCMCVCTHTRMSACMHACMHACKFACVHVCLFYHQENFSSLYCTQLESHCTHMRHKLVERMFEICEAMGCRHSIETPQCFGRQTLNTKP